MKDQNTKERFIQLRAEGWSYNKISKELGVGKSTLTEWGKQFDAEIRVLKKINWETLLEQYSLSKQSRVKLFAELFKAMGGEFKKRNFQDVPTSRLAEMIFRCYEILKAEIEPIEREDYAGGMNGTTGGQVLVVTKEEFEERKRFFEENGLLGSDN